MFAGMRFRFRAIFVASPLFVAIACSGGGGQCLNPIPDFPSCGSKDDGTGFNSGGASSSAAGRGVVDGVPSASGAPAMGAGGSGVAAGGDRGGTPNEPAAGTASEDFGGAGGDSATDPAAPEAGAAGAVDAAGAANGLGDLP